MNAALTPSERPTTTGTLQTVQAGDLQQAACDAYIYGLSLIEMAHTRQMYVAGGRAQNRLHHRRALLDHTARVVTTPNVDTLYSSTWIDTRQGPLTLVVPPIEGRYFSVALMDMFSNNNAVLGGRMLGTAERRLTIAGPGQAASGPDVVQLATPCGWMIVRILADGPHDLQALALQDGFTLEGPTDIPIPESASTDLSAPACFASLRRLLKENPPLATDTALLDRTMPLLELAAHSPHHAAAMEAGVAQARALLATADAHLAYIDGWNYPAPNLGDFGQDYLYRARIAQSALGALPCAEAMYFRALGDGRPGFFEGEGPYLLHLPAGIPVDGFWSLTMYEATQNKLFLTENPLNRYLISDRSPGLQYNADGSIDIHIDRDAVAAGRSANGLPAPAHGPFALYMRFYLPRKALIEGRWRLPPVIAA